MNTPLIAILAILLLIGSVTATLADSSIPGITAGKMTLGFNYGGGGFSLRYGGVSLIRESTLWVHSPDWRTHYYGYNHIANDLSSQKIDGGMEALVPYHSSDFLGQSRVKLLPDRAVFDFSYKLTSDVKDADMEYCFGFLSASVISGCPFRAETEKGPVTGVIPTTAKSGNSMETMLTPSGIKSLSIDSRIGKLTLEIAGDPGYFQVFDARKVPAEWAEAAPVFWCGVLGTHLNSGEGRSLSMTLRVEPLAETVKPSASSKGGPVSAQENAAVRYPADRPVVVIPAPKQMKLSASDFPLTEKTQIVVADDVRPEELYGALSFISEVRALYDLDLKIVRESENPTSASQILLGDITRRHQASSTLAIPVGKEQGYAIRAGSNAVEVAGSDPVGAFYGMQTLKQLVKVNASGVYIQGCEISDYPSLKWRGALLYGGKESLPFHKKLIDRIFSRYKYNNLVIADGTIMWKCAPELNTSFCTPQEDVRKEVAYANQHCMDVSPLIQSLGHSVWMFANGQNRDIAEDANKIYGYCPSNPKSHELLFKVYDEALDLFHPKYFHIGHDEILNPTGFPHCDLCKKKTASDLILEDIRKLHDYLAARGVKSMVWGDMFLAPGEGTDATNAPNKAEALYRRQGLPKDIIVTDWHYAPAKAEEHVSIKLFQDQGLAHIACPWNRPENIEGYAEAAKRAGSMGYFQTAWVGWDSREEILKQNFDQFTAFILGAEFSWNGGERTLDNLPYNPAEEFRRQWERIAPDCTAHKGFTVDLAPLYNTDTNGWMNFAPTAIEPAVPRGEQRLDGDLFQLAKPSDPLMAIQLSGALDSKIAYPAKVEIPIGRTAKSLLFLHSASWPEAPGKTVGAYKVVYQDGTSQEIKLIYADNITAWSDARTCVTAPQIWGARTDNAQKVAIRRMEWRNPTPEKPIARVELVSAGTEAGPTLLALSGIAPE